MQSCPIALRSKDPNNRVPLKGVIGGYIGTLYGDYIGVYRTQRMGFSGSNTMFISGIWALKPVLGPLG